MRSESWAWLLRVGCLLFSGISCRGIWLKFCILTDATKQGACRVQVDSARLHSVTFHNTKCLYRKIDSKFLFLSLNFSALQSFSPVISVHSRVLNKWKTYTVAVSVPLNLYGRFLLCMVIQVPGTQHLTNNCCSCSYTSFNTTL
jgi:hypothetical protein